MYVCSAISLSRYLYLCSVYSAWIFVYCCAVCAAHAIRALLLEYSTVEGKTWINETNIVYDYFLRGKSTNCVLFSGYAAHNNTEGNKYMLIQRKRGEMWNWEIFTEQCAEINAYHNLNNKYVKRSSRAFKLITIFTASNSIYVLFFLPCENGERNRGREQFAFMCTWFLLSASYLISCWVCAQ